MGLRRNDGYRSPESLNLDFYLFKVYRVPCPLSIGYRTIFVGNRDDFYDEQFGRYSQLDINDTQTNGELNQLGNVFHLEFFHDLCPMGFYGTGTDAQYISDLFC